MYEPTNKEIKEMEKKLIKFCKENHVLMYNYMLTIKRIRAEPEEKLLMKKLMKQADEYKKRKKNGRRK